MHVLCNSRNICNTDNVCEWLFRIRFLCKELMQSSWFEQTWTNVLICHRLGCRNLKRAQNWTGPQQKPWRLVHCCARVKCSSLRPCTVKINIKRMLSVYLYTDFIFRFFIYRIIVTFSLFTGYFKTILNNIYCGKIMHFISLEFIFFI